MGIAVHKRLEAQVSEPLAQSLQKNRGTVFCWNTLKIRLPTALDGMSSAEKMSPAAKSWHQWCANNEQNVHLYWNQQTRVLAKTYLNIACDSLKKKNQKVFLESLSCCMSSSGTQLDFFNSREWVGNKQRPLVMLPYPQWPLTFISRFSLFVPAALSSWEKTFSCTYKWICSCSG